MSKLAKALTAAAGNAGESLYVEDVFSTYLYAGTGSAQTITNGIDLAGEGGMVWIANRDQNYVRTIYNTERGATKYLRPSLTGAESTNATTLTSFNADGFSVGSQVVVNQSGNSIVSWTFRKAEKFFDVVTYTGDGTNNRQIPHNLGSIPHFILVKSLGFSASWYALHYDGSSWTSLVLNSTAAGSTASGAVWGDGTNFVAPTSTDFTVASFGSVNADTYGFVAYLFASDAGGFGDDGSESIIKCGSFVPPASGEQEIYLGFEPQFIITFDASGGDNWRMFDVMRGWNQAERMQLSPNNTVAEFSLGNTSGYENKPTATGFIQEGHSPGDTHIYIAIRRPMKTPESGTEVFDPSFRITGDPTIASGFVTDMGIVASRTGGGTSDYHLIGSRLTGNLGMTTTSTNAEVTRGLEPLKWDYNNGWGGSDTASSFAVWYSFKRATGFFDVVAFNLAGTEAHNLGVTPELLIVKSRSGTGNWFVQHKDVPLTTLFPLEENYVYDNPAYGTNQWNNTRATSTHFTTGSYSNYTTNIAYLFATLAGVSKVGSYTGTGADLNVDCGFSTGARFVLIRRTDSTGDWYVWDSVRGIVAGNDPYLLLNSTAAEVTTTDYIDPLASGFTVTSSAPAALNASGGTYIFLAIA